MITRTATYTIDLDKGTYEDRWDFPLTCGDKNADKIQVTLMQGAAAATLSGLSAILYGVQNGNTTTFVAGSVSGNVVTVELDYTFYAVPGQLELLLELAEGTTVVKTPLRISAYVKSGKTDELISSGEQFTLAGLQAIVAACVTATGGANEGANAANDSAAAITGITAEASAVDYGQPPTAAVESDPEDGHLNILLGLPTGMRGTRTYSGSAITGISTTPTIYATGIDDAIAGDIYIYNGDDTYNAGNEYRCTLGGNAATALWVYNRNNGGVPVGATEPAGEQTLWLDIGDEPPEAYDMTADMVAENGGGSVQDALDAHALQLAPRFMRYTGKIYSVTFPAYTTSMTSAGTRGDDAVGLTSAASTGSAKATNDFDNLSPFNIIRCNGYVSAEGEPIPTAFEGEPAFALDGSNGDVWAFGITPWFKIEAIGDGSIKHSVSDMPHGAGWFPNPGSIRQDGTVRPYVMTACYRGSLGDDGKVASISGRVPIYNVSHNNQLTQCRGKGAQYCGYTSKDNFYLQELFTIEYATMNCQSIMSGDSSRNWQYTPAIAETGVRRFIVTNAQAASFYVGMCVSIGYPSTFSSGTTFNLDRGITTMHAKAGRVRITAITALEDGLNTALTVDASADFDTTATTVTISGTSYSAPCFLSTMPNYTGITDTVMGPSGSPRSNTNSLNDCRYRYVENPYGSMYLPYSDIIKNYPNVHVCYDCTKFSTAVTADYVTVAYTLSAHSGWYYMTLLGWDEENPSVRLGTLCTATSSTRWADGQYDDMVAGEREVLGSGDLNNGGSAGFAFANLGGGLGVGRWDFGLRLSSTGRCGRVAAAA